MCSSDLFALVSALLVLVGTLYAAAFGALLSLARGPDSGMEVWFALLQVVLAGLLVVGALRLYAHDQRWLIAAVCIELGFCVFWFLELGDVAPSTLGDGALALPLLYAGVALLAGGLIFLPEARAWTRRRPPAEEPATGA